MVFVAAVAFSTTGYSADKYVSGNIGISWLSDSDNEVKRTVYRDDNGATLQYDSGISVIGAYGCDYGDYRLEAEAGYQSGDIVSVYDKSDEETYEGFGDVGILTLMLNAAYDIDLGGIELYPFAGLGGVHVSFEDATLCGDAAENYENYPEERGEEGDSSYNDQRSVTGTSFAYQIGAGLAIPVADNIMLDARYRYFNAIDFSINGPSHTVDISSHSALLGLRVGM